SVFAALASFVGPYKVTGSATEYVRTGDQGAKFVFRFCSICGTNLFHTEEGAGEGLGVAVGAFADPDFPARHRGVREGSILSGCARRPRGQSARNFTGGRSWRSSW